MHMRKLFLENMIINLKMESSYFLIEQGIHPAGTKCFFFLFLENKTKL